MENSDDYIGDRLIASSTVYLVVGFTFVGLRVWARVHNRLALGWDDWLIIAALLPLVGYSINGYLAEKWGEGRHIIFVKDPEGFIKIFISIVVCYSSGVMITKTSILCLYNRIFCSGNLKRISWLTGIIVIVYNTSIILVAALQCIPLSTLWTNLPGRCITIRWPFLTLAIVNVVTDLMILAIPIKYVVNLQMSRARKLQVLGVFLLGGLVTIIGIVRCYYLAVASQEDLSYSQTDSAVWSGAELAAGIVAACLPTLAIFVSKSSPITTTFRRHIGIPSAPNRSYGSGHTRQRLENLELTIREQDRIDTRLHPPAPSSTQVSVASIYLPGKGMSVLNAQPSMEFEEHYSATYRAKNESIP